MLRRREFVAGSVAALMQMGAADASAPLSKSEICASFKDYSTIQNHVIQLQSGSVGRNCPAVTGDSRTAALVLPEVAGRTIQNWGFAGATIASLTPQLSALKAAGMQPPFLICMVGLNSVYYGLTDDGEWHKISDHIQELISVLKQVSPKICFMTVPAYEVKNGPALVSPEIARRAVAPLRELNKTISRSTTAAQVLCIDLAARMDEADGTLKKGLSLDGIHWSRPGVEFVTSALAEAVLKLTS